MSSQIQLNGKTVSIPKNFFDVGVKASFDQDVQANLTTEEFTFVLDAYKEITDWIAKGRAGGVGIFEGIPLTITESNKNLNQTVFKGIVNLQADTRVFPRLKEVQARLRQDNSLNQLSELLEPLDYGYLVEVGAITSSDFIDVDYVVNKIDSTVETITAFITIYLLSKQLADTIKEIGTTIATISGIAVSGVSGPVGATVYSVAVAILQIAYAATLIVLIIDFGTDLLRALVQPERTHKAATLKTLLSKACEFIGYRLESSIEDLDKFVYLPSNRNVDAFGERNFITAPGTITRGIPNVGDTGYTCNELFQIAREIFNGRFAILGKTVQFHTELSDYWVRQSGFKKPNVIQNRADESFRYNTDELKSSILIQFQTDLIDEYTIKNYKGTAFQVLTDAKTVEKPENKTIKNSDIVQIPLALGTRKDDLTPFEKLLLPLAGLFDRIADVFGGNPQLAKRIKNKVGVLQVSNNNHAVPKLLYLEGGRIPSNQREKLSAKTLWDKYHVEKSFVQNGFRRQRRLVEGEVIPFGLRNFVTLLNNSYFRDENGKIGKITDLEWRMNKDNAVISYWVSEPYTNNLKETFIEPD